MKTFIQHLITALIVLGIYLLIVVADVIVKQKTDLSVVHMILGGIVASQHDKIKAWLFGQYS